MVLLETCNQRDGVLTGVERIAQPETTINAPRVLSAQTQTGETDESGETPPIRTPFSSYPCPESAMLVPFISYMDVYVYSSDPGNTCSIWGRTMAKLQRPDVQSNDYGLESKQSEGTSIDKMEPAQQILQTCLGEGTSNNAVVDAHSDRNSGTEARQTHLEGSEQSEGTSNDATKHFQEELPTGFEEGTSNLTNMAVGSKSDHDARHKAQPEGIHGKHEESQQDWPKMLCNVCNTMRSSMSLFIPCRHVCACITCAQDISDCPKCKMIICKQLLLTTYTKTP